MVLSLCNSQESFSFSEFICLTGVSGIARLVTSPGNFDVMNCLAGRCDYFPRHTTNRCQEIQQLFGCISPCLLHLAFIPLNKALQTNIMQVNN